MAELIQKEDSLNKGREKLNEAIKQSDRAESKSDTAVSTANEAKQKSNNTQTQLDTIVLNGDSSVEAAQARVKEDGTSFATLRDRLNSADQHMAQNEDLIKETSIGVGWYIFDVPNKEQTEREWDWAIPIHKAINHVVSKGGGKVTFPSGKLNTSKTINFTSSYVSLEGNNIGSEIFYTGELYNSTLSSNGLAVLSITPTGAAHGVTIKNLTLNGDNKTLWGLFTERCYGINVENVRIKRSAGFMYSYHNYNSTYEKLLMEYSTPSKPLEMPQSDWDLVRDRGLIYTTLGNGDRFVSVKVYGFGMVDTPARALFYINTETTTVNSIVVERDNLFLNNMEQADKTSVNHLFWLIGGHIDIQTQYLEHFSVLSLLTSTANGTHNISFKNAFVNLSQIYYYPFQLLAGKEFDIENVFVFGTSIKSSYMVYFGDNNKATALNTPILWYDSKNKFKEIDGIRYADPEKISTGIKSSNGIVMADGSTLPRIVSGFSVKIGLDEIGDFVAVENGKIINHKGKQINLGIHSGKEVGWILRPSLSTNASYNICIDVNGGVYTERDITPEKMNTGKVIIATLAIGGTLDDKTLTPVDNSYTGIVFNEGNNKMVYNRKKPDTGLWNKGDIACNTSLSEVGAVGSKYVEDRWIRLENDWLTSKIPTGN